ncbi:efflux RND transporter periplasmic adaptor subunit [Phenylobacterium sp.]|uniref:efflux RND transporter periplasmic adaptor subunit n=1 Tax=Phenylobacterium sp. TaxID=1871053 RepID=UPI002731BC97|nr:efflux RND transporter periplasmic adaptor subunit [Phenylobacterium sp.]MDP1873263.1 efflux RND transporter periplasmic adaptor subunit [Phenylobacterium sp.]
MQGRDGQLRRTIKLTAIAGFASVLAACGGGAEPPAAQAPAPAVEAAAVRAASAQTLITATGALARQREAQLAFRVPGVITSLTVDEGDVVRAGQVIAQLDPTAVEAGRQQAKAALDRARRDLERDQALFDKGFVSRQRIDDRKSALSAAEAAYSAAAFDRRWATLTAPTAGVVLSRAAAAGQVVQPGQAVVTIADAGSPFVLRVPVPDRQATRIAQGATAQVEVGDQTLPGRVILIGGASAAGAGTVDVEIEIAAAPGLRSGQVGRAQIAASAPRTADGFSRIPAEAIQEAENGRAFVLRLDGDVARRTAVTFGGFDGDDALVAGLAPGARVITAGGGFVGDGDKVQVIDPAALIAQTSAATAKGAVAESPAP